jgi:DnaD/phage-associated family protein
MSGCLSRASKSDLCVLITLAAAQKDNLAEDQLAALLKISLTELRSSLSFWRGAGIITSEDAPSETAHSTKETPMEAFPGRETDKNQQKIPDMDRSQKDAKEKKPSKILEAEIKMPVYTSDQITKFVEGHKDMSELIDACQQTLGKIFNTSEVSSLIGMRDYLNLDSDYILLLMADSAKKDKKSLRYIEKTALSLHDAEITTYPELEEHLAMIQSLAEKETKLRNIFGIGRRALTKKEKECFARWINEFHYDTDIIEFAYEITISNIHEPSVPYTNAIIESWNEKNLKTREEIEAHLEEAKKKKEGEKQMSSYNVGDFFDDAIKRSYE